jgi:hypothetical protein
MYLKPLKLSFSSTHFLMNLIWLIFIMFIIPTNDNTKFMMVALVYITNNLILYSILNFKFNY